MRALFHENVERHRKLSRFGSTVRTTSLVDTTKLVDHRAADAQRLTADFRIVPRELTPGATAPAVELAKQHAMDDAKSSVSAGNVAGKPVATARGFRRSRALGK